MARTLLVFHSIYGQTRKIAGRIREVLEARGEEVDLAALREREPDPRGYDKILLGCSIRNGKHSPALYDFITRHKALLDKRPSAFFSVNLVARKPHKNTPETNPYTRAFLEKSPWKPDLVGVFGGNLDYQRYTFSDRHIIRFIMWMNKGPTDLSTNAEFTNWEEVERFANRFAELGVREAA